MVTETANLRSRARLHLLESADLQRRVADECIEPILDASQVIATAFRAGGKLLLCGNGGSAADCQHMAAELVSQLSKHTQRQALPAIALTTDTSILTAVSNDVGYDGVFERQVEALGKPEDVLIGISTSGNSKSVLRAMDAAKAVPMRTIALTGSGGKLAGLADVPISVPGENTQHIQECHLAIEHALCDLVERLLFGDVNGPETR